MNRLIRFELSKLFKKNSFKLLLVLTIISCFLTCYISNKKLNYEYEKYSSVSIDGLNKDSIKLVKKYNVYVEKLNEIDNISKNVTMKLNSDKIKLDNYEAAIKLLSPLNILKRGYSISYLNGKAITDANCIKEGDIIETQLYNGKIESKITKIKSNER